MVSKRRLYVPAISPNIGGSVRPVGNSNPDFRYDSKAMSSVDYNSIPRTQTGGGGGPIKPFTIAKGIWDGLDPNTKQKIIDSSKERVKKFMKRKKGNSNDDFSGGNTSYALSKSPNPATVSLNSGIKPNAYVSDYLDASEDKCSPLHMTGAYLEFPTFSGSRLLEYFESIVAFDLQTKAQANVGFNLNISSSFSVSNILSAMNALMYALQIYYYYSSILTYHSDPANKNEGMIKLRNGMSSDFMEALTLLGRRLADTPTPPRMLELVRYLFSNYYSGPNQGSAMIKIVPHTITTSVPSSMIGVGYITSALDSLSLGTNNEVYSLLRRAVPQWRPSVLKDVPVTPIYDANFLTIFSNLPFEINPTINTFSTYPQVSTSDTELSYNSFTNNLDGVAFALTSAYIGADTKEYPGLMVPVDASGSNTGNTRASYYIDIASNSKTFVASDKFDFLVRSRQDSYKVNEARTALVTPHLYGCDKLRGVTINTITETCLSVIEWIMSLETIRTGMPTSTRKSRN